MTNQATKTTPWNSFKHILNAFHLPVKDPYDQPSATGYMNKYTQPPKAQPTPVQNPLELEATTGRLKPPMSPAPRPSPSFMPTPAMPKIVATPIPMPSATVNPYMNKPTPIPLPSQAPYAKPPLNVPLMRRGIRNQVIGEAKKTWNDPKELAALDQLLMKESGYDPRAKNPKSTAYGLFQFLDPTWGNYGHQKTNDVAGQTKAGIDYIRRRYGRPSEALKFHDNNNYY